MRKQLLGSESLDAGVSGRLTEAEAAFREVIEMRRAVTGSENTASDSIFYLGGVLRALGRSFVKSNLDLLFRSCSPIVFDSFENRKTSL